jgi:hypothetical protein
MGSSVVTFVSLGIEPNATELFRVVSSSVPVTEPVFDQNILFALLERFDVHVRAAMKLLGDELAFSRTYKLGKHFPNPMITNIFLYVLYASEPVPNTKKMMYPVTISPHLSTVTWPNAGTLTTVLKRWGSCTRDQEYGSTTARQRTTRSQRV